MTTLGCFPISSFLVVAVVAVQEQRNASAAGADSTVGESSPPDRVPSKDTIVNEENREPISLKIQQLPGEEESHKFNGEDGIEASLNVEHQFIPSLATNSPVHESNQPGLQNLSVLRNGFNEEISILLQLGEPESKRRRLYDSSEFGIEELNKQS